MRLTAQPPVHALKNCMTATVLWPLLGRPPQAQCSHLPGPFARPGLSLSSPGTLRYGHGNFVLHGGAGRRSRERQRLHSARHGQPCVELQVITAGSQAGKQAQAVCHLMSCAERNMTCNWSQDEPPRPRGPPDEDLCQPSTSGYALSPIALITYLTATDPERRWLCSCCSPSRTFLPVQFHRLGQDLARPGSDGM